jgi:mannosyltransferase
VGDPTAVSHAGAGVGLDEDPPGGSPRTTQRGKAAYGGALARWWPLAALLVLAAALRLSTLNLQSFWYDEAYTPVHVLHPSLVATLESVAHHENTPPLWYVLIWGWSRIFGTGEVALRLPSALVGIATVAVAWGIGWELAGRRVAIAAAVLVAVNPLFVWYSQEARAYGLFVALAALAMWCCLRADADPTPRRPKPGDTRLRRESPFWPAAFALSGAAALATHYFAVFLLAPMCLWLLRRRERWKVTLPAVAAIGAAGAALVPLALTQGGHGTQWIGEWALASRLETIPQYYLTGYSGAPLGHGVELLVALAILAGMGYGLWRALTPREADAALLALGLAACGVLIPAALAVGGADYLAPRNVVAAMIPLTAGIAVIVTGRRTGRVGMALAALIALAFLALSIDVNLSPRLQRGDWRGLAQAIREEPAGGVAGSGLPGGGVAGGGVAGGGLPGGGLPRGSARAPAARAARVITTVELGAAPLEYYLPPLRNLPRGASVRVSEIDETGYEPLMPGAGTPPAPGFRLVQRRDVNGLILYRFRSATPRTVSEATLREHVIAEGRPEVLANIDPPPPVP